MLPADPCTISVGTQAAESGGQGVLSASHQPSHEFVARQRLAGVVEGGPVHDFDLATPLSMVEIRDSAPQRGASVLGVKRGAGHPQAAFVVVQTCFEIRHQHVVKLVGRLEEVADMAAPSQHRHRCETRGRLVLLPART